MNRQVGQMLCKPKLNGWMLREWKRRIRVALGLRNTFGDRVIIYDEVLVWQGDKLLFKSKAHIVNQALIWMLNLLITIGNTPNTNSYSSYTWTTTFANAYMRVGTGTGVTVGTMTGLVTPNATAPNAQSGATATPTTGTYRASWVSTWNAGTLPAITVTELGLWLAFSGHTSFQSFGWQMGGFVDGAAFFSRLSSSDGDFTAFVVNTAVPLTIEWRLTYTFA